MRCDADQLPVIQVAASLQFKAGDKVKVTTNGSSTEATVVSVDEKAGKVRILGVDTLERVADEPNVPTFTEQGVPLTLSFWQGIVVPAKTPDAIVERLRKAMSDVLADPQTRTELEKVGVTIGGAGIASAKDPDAYMQREYERWGTVIRGARITSD